MKFNVRNGCGIWVIKWMMEKGANEYQIEKEVCHTSNLILICAFFHHPLYHPYSTIIPNIEFHD